MQDIRKFERSGSYGATNIFIGSRTLIPGRAVMFATRNDFRWDGLFTKTDGMPYDTNLIFKLDKDDAYIVSGYFRIPSNNGKEPANWKAKEKEMLDGMEKRYRADFLKGLRERQEYEVSNQSGICLIRGFIADDGGKPFKANTA
ncbi:T6SS immunity protein Tli4 family protein, partial [Neisseria sp. P0008.S010]